MKILITIFAALTLFTGCFPRPAKQPRYEIVMYIGVSHRFAEVDEYTVYGGNCIHWQEGLTGHYFCGTYEVTDRAK
jgi:hypothetical protein